MPAPTLSRRLMWLVASVTVVCHVAAGQARGGEGPTRPGSLASGALERDVIVCPQALYLETVMVRAPERFDAAGNLLHVACMQASAASLARWRAQAQTSSNASMRACAAHMGAQGCLMGPASTRPNCRGAACLTSQSCMVRLVRL